MTKIPDYKAKTLKNKFQRPYFSPKINSYEMDYVSSGKFKINDEVRFRHYLGVININTKYLFMIPLELNTNETLLITYEIIKQINEDLRALNKNMEINNIRGDGDKKFGSIVDSSNLDGIDLPKNNKIIKLGEFDTMNYTKNIFTEYLKQNNITMYLNPSKFTNKNRVIDRAIRTIRDKVGENQSKWLDKEIIQKAVNEYNHTPHLAFNKEFTPYEVQFYRDLEEYFIRQHTEELEDINKKQSEAKLFDYKLYNVLLIHLDLPKTPQMFKKQRREFNKLAIFKGYEHGNVKCSLLNLKNNKISADNDYITVPIYYTKLISKDVLSIPEEYMQLLF
jgi:hypothetical protein